MKYFTPEQINAFFPVVGFVSFPGGVIIRRQSLLRIGGKNYKHQRGTVTVLSRRSLNKFALLVRSSGVKWQSVWTLSYGVNYPLDGKIAKQHLNKFLIYAKREFGEFQYFWVLEFQQRGAVHFHIGCTLPPPNIFQRQRLADIWQNISTPMSWRYTQVEFSEFSHCYGDELSTDMAVWEVHTHHKSWERVRDEGGMSHYLAKYANKLYQKTVPGHYRNVGRFWGVSSGVRLPEPSHFFGDDRQIREALTFAGRDVGQWECLPQIVLVG